jgi:hypothetical protein
MYAVDELAERYRTAILYARAGLECAGLFGMGHVSPSALSPMAIAKADGFTVGSYYCADLGALPATGGIAPWEDQWGANDLSQVVDTTYRPQLVVESTLGRRASITGDGVDDHFNGGPNPPVPGTTPYTMRLVARCNAWVSGGRLLGGTIRCGAASETIMAFNTGAFLTAELPMADDVWTRLKLYSSNSAADYFQAGPVANIDTTNLGNGDRGAIPIFSAQSGPADVSSFSLASFLYCSGADLSAAADTVLDQFYRAYYGANVTLG